MTEEFNPLDRGDECIKLLDNGWTIQLFRNELGSYTGVAIPPSKSRHFDDPILIEDGCEVIEAKDRWMVDDITPTRTLRQLTDSVLFGRTKDGDG